MILPLVVEYARMCPSSEPEKTAPEIAETAADWAGLHGLRLPHPGAGVVQIRSPLSTRKANIPPPRVGSGRRPVAVRASQAISDKPAYTSLPSLAAPHWKPRRVPPLPPRVCQRTFPR